MKPDVKSRMKLDGPTQVFSVRVRGPALILKTEDVVGAVPTGDAPTTSEWSTILLPTKVQLILEVSQYKS